MYIHRDMCPLKTATCMMMEVKCIFPRMGDLLVGLGVGLVRQMK